MAEHHLMRGEFSCQSSPFVRGLEMKISFVDYFPDPDSIVVLIQALQCKKGPNLENLNEHYKSGGSGSYKADIWTLENHPEAWAIDAPGDKRVCPAFGMDFTCSGNAWNRWNSSNAGVNAFKPGSGRIGKVTLDPINQKMKIPTFLPALLFDRASRKDTKVGTAFRHSFETVALRIFPGNNSSVSCKVLGAIKWGYEVCEDAAQSVNVLPAAATPGPSQNWIDAAKKWNAASRIQSHIPGSATDWVSTV